MEQMLHHPLEFMWARLLERFCGSPSLKGLLVKELPGPRHSTMETNHRMLDETWKCLSPPMMQSFQPCLPLLQTQANTLVPASPTGSLPTCPTSSVVAAPSRGAPHWWGLHEGAERSGLPSPTLPHSPGQ